MDGGHVDKCKYIETYTVCTFFGAHTTRPHHTPPLALPLPLTHTHYNRGSPLSAAVTLSYFQRSRAAGWGPVEVLQQDYLLCGHFMSRESDFYEGVRARLIDKDDTPHWQHSSTAEVRDGGGGGGTTWGVCGVFVVFLVVVVEGCL